MSNQIIGSIVMIGQTHVFPSKVGGNDFRKRELVIDASTYDRFTGDKRENFVNMEFTGNKCTELDHFNVGDLVAVSYVLQGRKYEKDGIVRYFTNIVGYKVESYGNTHEEPMTAPMVAQEPVSPQVVKPEEKSDELPF